MPFAAPSLSAQAPTETFEACFVPEVGAVCLVNREGLPDACLDESHVAITWNESGVEVADGSVTEPKLAFDPATRAVNAPGYVQSRGRRRCI